MKTSWPKGDSKKIYTSRLSAPKSGKGNGVGRKGSN